MKPDEHENCGAGYVCIDCGDLICPRCNPSPRELKHICADCDWLRGDAA